MNMYSITVKNESGSHQHYALFSKAPQVTGTVQGQVWSNVFATANTPKQQTAQFTVYKQYYAVCGSSNGSPDQGVQVSVGQTLPVTLGVKKPDGTVVHGTTVGLIDDGGAPAFSDTLPAASSYPNAFEIDTHPDFTVQDAKDGNWLIGLGGSSNGTGSTGPAATFMPEPNVKYQIQPVNTYYVCFGDFTKGALIDVTKIGGSTCTIDFTHLPSSVTIVHDAEGELVLQKE